MVPALGADNNRLKADLGKEMEARWALEAAAPREEAAREVNKAELAKARKEKEALEAKKEEAMAASLEVTRELAARTRKGIAGFQRHLLESMYPQLHNFAEEALPTEMRAAWPAAAVAKIAKDGLKQLDSLCYECGDDAKENDGLQQVVRSALADVD